jgi:hypothetical protein
MADWDTMNDPTPQNPIKRATGTKPTIAALKSALTTADAATYTTARLLSMTKNDLVFACKTLGLTVTGI